MDVLHQEVVLIVVSQHNHGRFDALINVSLAVGRGQDYNARVAFFREAINAVVVILVEHPELKFLSQLLLGLTFLTTEHGQLYRWVIQDHV